MLVLLEFAPSELSEEENELSVEVPRALAVVLKLVDLAKSFVDSESGGVCEYVPGGAEEHLIP